MAHNDTICFVIARYDQLWPHLTQNSPDSDQFCYSASAMITYDIRRQ